MENFLKTLEYQLIYFSEVKIRFSYLTNILSFIKMGKLTTVR